MTTTLTLLGTAGGPTPRGTRHAPSQVVVVNGDAYVFDCGNGVADQLARAGVPFSALRAVFVTHNHSDHNADVGNLLLLGWSGIATPVRLYGPPPISSMVKQFLDMNSYDIDIRVLDEGRAPLDELVSVHDISTGGVVYADEHVRVTATLVDHPPVQPAFGYRIDTPERSIVFSGDTRPCDALVELARGADTLVHEVLYEPGIAHLEATHNGKKLREHLISSHTPVERVGSVAERAGVPLLVLSHFTPSDDSVDDAIWLAEARRGYTGHVVVGRDLLEIQQHSERAGSPSNTVSGYM
ncbi:MAG: MBL fold metallo-hydrolase [Sciscionella sp.]